MGRESRDFETADIISHARTASDSYGGIAEQTDVVVVEDYTFGWFLVSPFTRSEVVKTYGLSDNAEVFRISGPYDASIQVGHFVTFSGNEHRILAANKVRGVNGAVVRLAMLVLKVEG